VEDTAVIDASTFAISHNAFWHETAPMCEHFIRKVNMAGVERFDAPMPQSATIDQRALIAEFAFSLFVELRERADHGARSREEIESAAWIATETRLAPYVRFGLKLTRVLNEEARSEVRQILQRLCDFFDSRGDMLVLRPLFYGCGFIDASEGDLILGGIIYEIKTVDRPFRGTDIRQAITYAALNYASSQFEISGLGLMNPRRGLYYEISLEEASIEISGRPPQDLFAQIIQAISSGEISR
jgi:hypothetical protein